MAHLNNGSVRLGYNNSPWTFSHSNDDKYLFEADPIKRKLMPFRDECFTAAKEIYEAYDKKPVYVMFSGGIDSEAVLNSFVKTETPVIAVCIKFKDGHNDHELAYAQEYFDKVNFDKSRIKVIDFDIKDWLRSNECKYLAEEAQTVELGYTHLFKVALDHLGDGVTITGHEEPYCHRVDNEDGTSKWVFHNHERHYSIHKFFLKFGRAGVPSFFQWSSELLNSFMFNDHWTMLFNNMYSPTIWGTEQLKYGFLGKAMQLKPRIKYTSFEKVIPEILAADQAWKSSLPVTWSRSRDYEIYDWFERCGVKLNKNAS